MSKFKINPELLIGGSSEIDAVFLPVNIDPDHYEDSELTQPWSARDAQHHQQHSYHNHSHRHHHHHKPEYPQKPLSENGGVFVEVVRGPEKVVEAAEEELTGPSSVLIHAITTKTPDSNDWCYRATLTSIGVIIIIVFLLVFGHSYIRSVLLWLEEVDPLVSVSVLTSLFVVICFPMAWGLSLLMVTAGYLYGFLYGPLVVTMCVTIGLAISTPIMRFMCSGYFRSHFYSRKVEAIVNVVSGSHGMKVVALTRLTPIPFGLQNALFSLSTISLLRYLISSVGGLIPMTVLNCYMGSTLRTMQDLMSDDSNRLTGFFIFGGQILMTVMLLWFVVRKARVELKKAMDESEKASLILPTGDCAKTVFVDHDGT